MSTNHSATWRFYFHKLGSPPSFYKFASVAVPWLGLLFALLMCLGLYTGLVVAPTDYQQGESYRIIYIHVPSAWMSMFVYLVLAISGGITLIWRMKLAEAIGRASAPIGALYTGLAIITGSLWGKPMWGTWWIWDARLTSELILLIFYLGYMALQNSIDDRRTASRAGGILALVGLVNLPVIHYSVIWWNTLHQGPTITKFDQPSIALSMLIPLLIMAAAFFTHYLLVLFVKARADILYLESRTNWVTKLLGQKNHD